MIDSILPPKIRFKRLAGRVFEAIHRQSGAIPGVRVLTYHKISDDYINGEWAQMTTPKRLFEEQLKFLKDAGYRSIGAEEVVPTVNLPEQVPARRVCITFDDGYADNYINAMPVLQHAGFKATVFITTDFIDRDGYLSSANIKEMKSSGVFSFGSHTQSHPNLPGLSAQRLKEETDGAKKRLEDILSSKVETFAYPYGWQNSFNGSVVEAVRQAGYVSAFTGIHGANKKDTDRYLLRRMRVSWLEDLPEMNRIMDGSYDWYSIYQGMVSLWQRPQ